MTKYNFPYLLSGMGASIEVYPVPHVYTIRRPFEGLTDAQRLASDWYLVGHALHSTMNSSMPEQTVAKEKEPVAVR